MEARPTARRLAFLTVVTLLLAGCITHTDTPSATIDAGAFEAGGAAWTVNASSGAASALALAEGGATEVTFPKGVLVFGDDGRLLPGETVTLDVAPGDSVTFIPPPGADAVDVTLGGESVTIATPRGDAPFVSGERIIELLEVQRDNYPYRYPGHENYALSHEYFIEYFENLGYDVEYDPYGTMALEGVKLPNGATRGVSPASFANIVAYKPGANAGTADERYLVVGGHYDTVEETVHGAFDNTAGTVAVMELARAFADVETEHTLIFGLWGGEEDGILGSRYWVETNAEKIPRITAHVNLDVTGMAWPGPLDHPDPILVTGAPDGPLATRMLDSARVIFEEYARFTDAEVLYQPWVAGGQVGGAGINAQSDHTSFASKGIPSYMISTGNMDAVFSLIHTPEDTLENMIAYAATGQVPFGGVLTDEEEAVGRDLLARGFEAQTYPVLYFVTLVDAGVLSPQG